MKQTSETKLNIISSLLLQTVSGICGLILPRVVLARFGSEANGLVASVLQLLNYTVLLEGGIGGVMRAALYKPLANRDMVAVSGIYHQICSSFRRISYFFIAFACLLAAVMKFLVDTKYNWLYVCSIVLILSFGNYFNYYFALPQRLLMTADQKLYIIQFAQATVMVLNLLVCLSVIKIGGGIHAVKLSSALVYLIIPIILRIYVKQNYRITELSGVSNVSLPQKRDGVIHHLAYFIHGNTDVVILSLLSSLTNISVYSVYRTVINILENVLGSISSGLGSAVGNLLAKDEINALNKLVDRYEMWNNALATAVATVCSILILPFVSIYTSGVTDTEYIQPVFAFLMIAGSYAYSVRHPFGCVLSASGHYRETKVGAVGEMTLNLGLSLLLVKPLGLAGVALGTFVAMSFRTVYTVWYLSKNILLRPMHRFFLRMACNVLVSSILICWIPTCFQVTASNIWGLLICAIKVSAVVFPIFAVLNALLSINSFKVGADSACKSKK